MTAKTVARKQTNQSTTPSTPRRPRGRPRQFNREHGLRQAMKLFWTFGYEATSMADLRACLGVTQASLYAAYGNKESLFREVVDLYRRTEGNTTTRALAHPGSAKQAIHAMLQDAVEAFTSPGAPGGCLVVLAGIHCTADNRAVQDHLATLRQETVKGIRERLKQAQEGGELPAGCSVGELASYYAAVLHGLSIPARDGASRKELTGIVNLAMAVWPSSAHPADPLKPPPLPTNGIAT